MCAVGVSIRLHDWRRAPTPVAVPGDRRRKGEGRGTGLSSLGRGMSTQGGELYRELSVGGSAGWKGWKSLGFCWGG